MEESEKSSQFWPPKNPEDGAILLGQAKPTTTQYKNKWAVNSFKNWQKRRVTKLAALESGSVFKHHIHCVQSLEENLEDIDSLSLKLLAHKIHQEVTNKMGGCYPAALNLLDFVDRHLCLSQSASSNKCLSK